MALAWSGRLCVPLTKTAYTPAAAITATSPASATTYQRRPRPPTATTIAWAAATPPTKAASASAGRAIDIPGAFATPKLSSSTFPVASAAKARPSPRKVTASTAPAVAVKANITMLMRTSPLAASTCTAPFCRWSDQCAMCQAACNDPSVSNGNVFAFPTMSGLEGRARMCAAPAG